MAKKSSSTLVRQPIVDTPAWSDFKKWWIGQEKSGRSHDIVRLYDEHPLILPTLNITDSSIFVIDIASMRYIYLSPNMEEFLGWPRSHLMEGGVEFVFNQIHPSDIPGVMAFSELINDHFKNLPDSQKAHHRTFWDFRLKDSSGNYYKIIQQDCALKYNGEGKIDELLLFASKIDSVISLDRQHLRLTNARDDLFYKFDQKTGKPLLLENLTRREMEIAKLIAKSNSLKNVASQLNISFNTVKVHSANMLRKLDVKDSLEMVNILRTWRFI